MKRNTRIFHTLLGVVALMLTAVIAIGRLTWRAIRDWWKKRSKWVRRSMVALLVSVFVGFLAIVAYACYDSEYGRRYWNDKYLSENVVAYAFRDNTYRVYNEQTDKYTTPKINWVSEAFDTDSLAVYAMPHKRGYINVNTGEILIDASENDYSKAWVFSQGLAAVMKDGKVGFINAGNEVVIPFQFDYSDKCTVWNFGYLFYRGYCVMTNKDGDVGIIDTLGNWVVEPTYDEILSPDDNGYRVVVDGGKYGILDTLCNVVYPAEYDCVDVLSDGYVLNKDGRKWQVDFEKNVVQQFMFDATYYLNYPVGYNDDGSIRYAFADYLKYEVINRYGIMNRITGEPVTPALYSDINMLSQELFEVQCPESYDWHLFDIDKNSMSGKR